MREFEFAANPQEMEYRMFSSEWEEASNVGFHATALANLEAILKDGLRPDIGNLGYNCLAMKSSGALSWTATNLQPNTAEWVILAFDLDGLCINKMEFDTPAKMIRVPEVIPGSHLVGYCKVPVDYRFV